MNECMMKMMMMMMMMNLHPSSGASKPMPACSVYARRYTYKQTDMRCKKFHRHNDEDDDDNNNNDNNNNTKLVIAI